MQAYRFTTRVSGKGKIQVPDGAALSGKEVEVIVLAKVQQEPPITKARGFVNKWAGALEANDSDENVKHSYLAQKHRLRWQS